MHANKSLRSRIGKIAALAFVAALALSGSVQAALPDVTSVTAYITDGTTIFTAAATLTGVIIAVGILFRMASKVGSKR